jgi:hypothetical protein
MGALARPRMSGDVGNEVRCHPVIHGFGRMAAGRENWEEDFRQDCFEMHLSAA